VPNDESNKVQNRYEDRTDRARIFEKDQQLIAEDDPGSTQFGHQAGVSEPFDSGDMQMNCREIRSELNQMADGSLSDDRAIFLSEHLVTCPLCRDELAALRSIRGDLGSLVRPDISVRSLTKLRNIVAGELTPAYGYPAFQLIEGKTNWWQRWFLPTAVGSFASVVLGLALLGVILIPSDVPQLAIDTDENSQNGDPLFLASIDPNLGDQFITPQQFAHSRADVSTESPSINPAGTLVALNSADLRNANRDEEVVVVAEIYGDGDARITNVVESSRDKRKMERLQAAFRSDKVAPPFVPASLDNRGEMVRVILKFQNVNVNIDADDSLR
jgi:hypothetical protein